VKSGNLLSEMRLVIVSKNASIKMGGESARPLQYFLYLFGRSFDVRLVTHERNRQELMSLIPDTIRRVHFVADRLIQRLLWRSIGLCRRYSTR